MLDVKRNGKKHEEDYILIKKTIEEIVGKSKGKAPENAKKTKKKNQEPEGRSENLMKQFFGLQQFQKGLAAATLDGSNKIDVKKLTKLEKKYSESSSEESEYGNVSMFSSSTFRRNVGDKYHTKERSKMEEYNTDELSDTTFSEELELEKDYNSEGTVSERSYSEVTSSKYDNVPKVDPELSGSSKNQTDPSSDQPKKKKCLLSPSELAIIKELCRDLIKKEEKPKEDREQVELELPVKECVRETKVEENSIKEKEIVEKSGNKIQQEQGENLKSQILTENKEKQKFKIVPGYNKQQEYNLIIENSVQQKNKTEFENEKFFNFETEYPKQEKNKTELGNTRNPNFNTETENFQTNKNKNQLDTTKNHNDKIIVGTTEDLKYNIQQENIFVLNSPNFESAIYESTSTEETPESVTEQNKLNEITEYVEESNGGVTNAVIVKGELTLISEQKEDAIEFDEKFEQVHLEIVTKETVEEVEEWKQRIEETVVIEKTVKVNKEEAKEVIEEVEKETTEVVLCNMSDDDLIRKTMSEMDQIDQEFMMEKTSPGYGNEDYYYYNDEMEYRDGIVEQRRNLQERLDFLQEQIHSLRTQLDEAKRQNEEEAREVGYLSQLLGDREASLLRSGLDWEDWELKEMVRERLEQRRQAAAQDYQARLRVVEALCSAEMGKLEEALQTLLPLNATVSAWDPPSQPIDLNSRSSWQTSDYFFEVVTSMNLSSTDDNGVSGDISTNGEQPSLAKEQTAEG